MILFYYHRKIRNDKSVNKSRSNGNLLSLVESFYEASRTLSVKIQAVG